MCCSLNSHLYRMQIVTLLNSKCTQTHFINTVLLDFDSPLIWKMNCKNTNRALKMTGKSVEVLMPRRKLYIFVSKNSWQMQFK